MKTFKSISKIILCLLVLVWIIRTVYFEYINICFGHGPSTGSVFGDIFADVVVILTVAIALILATWHLCGYLFYRLYIGTTHMKSIVIILMVVFMLSSIYSLINMINLVFFPSITMIAVTLKRIDL